MPATAVYSPEILKTITGGVHQESKTGKAQAPGVGPEQLVPAVHPSPQDWRDVWMYFILIDRFNNPSKLPKGRWDDPIFDRFQGGNLKGIIEKLDYIKSLGAGAIWLSPPFKNCIWNDRSYHGYGIQDFLSVDPRFGTEEDLERLVFETHKRDMQVIIDIVLNYVGDVFKYDLGDDWIVDEAPWNKGGYKIKWVDESGNPMYETLPSGRLNPNEGVWPTELQNESFYRCKGTVNGNVLEGDYYDMKELITEYRQDGMYPVRDALIKAYQYTIARYDVDGFRIDALRYVERDFCRIFGNAIREFALSIGKKNFLTFGDVYDKEYKLISFAGRSTGDEWGPNGVDAALDFQLFHTLPRVIKGFAPPSELIKYMDRRKFGQQNLTCSHGESGKFFMTFLDNHDQKERFYFDDGSGTYDAQAIMGIGALFTLQGIPCIYYGTDQGLHGKGETDRAVRQAFWGKDNAFDETNPFFLKIRALAQVRNGEPALRYGRQYFREVSLDGIHFEVPNAAPGVLAYSRILNCDEVLIILNTSTKNQWKGEVLVDYSLNKGLPAWKLRYSNMDSTPGAVTPRVIDNAVMHKSDGWQDRGKICTFPVSLLPMELQILKKD